MNDTATKAVVRLLQIEQASTLPSVQFWRAIHRIASCDATLRASLTNSSVSIGKPDATKTERPIEITEKKPGE